MTTQTTRRLSFFTSHRRIRHSKQILTPLVGAVLILTSIVHGQSDDALRRKIGQMLILGYIGQSVTDTLIADLSTRNLGGVILLSGNGNFVSPSQIQQATGLIRSVSQTPPFMALDQEGGTVARLKASDGFANTYSAYTLGTTFASLDSTRKQAALMASWVKSCGFNVNFAPVADVNVNPASPAIGALGRSFSADPLTVTAHDKTFIDEFHAQNIITTLKHFPGHGSAGTDSHLTLPDITATWSASELTPYEELEQSNSIDMVMVGHLFNATIDSVYPSSLSRATIQGLLRDSLHYPGVVITDDLYNMKAITDNFGFFDAAEHSINAGTDILLYVSNLYNGASLCRQLIDTIESKVHRGLIADARINEAYGRILQLKHQYAITSVSRPFASGTSPRNYELGNYPNPFNPSTIIRFSLPATGAVSLKIFNVLGQEIETLLDGNVSAGTHEVRWNATTRGSGIYYCRLQAGAKITTAKLVLLK